MGTVVVLQLGPPLAACSALIGLDSGAPCCRRNTAGMANDPTADNSDRQFCRHASVHHAPNGLRTRR